MWNICDIQSKSIARIVKHCYIKSTTCHLLTIFIEFDSHAKSIWWKDKICNCCLFQTNYLLQQLNAYTSQQQKPWNYFRETTADYQRIVFNYKPSRYPYFIYRYLFWPPKALVCSKAVGRQTTDKPTCTKNRERIRVWWLPAHSNTFFLTLDYFYSTWIYVDRSLQHLKQSIYQQKMLYFRAKPDSCWIV